MLQRIQSVYLVLSIGIVTTCFYVPFGFVNEYSLECCGAKTQDEFHADVNTYFFLLPIGIAGMLTLIGLFWYRNRVRQMTILRSSLFLFPIFYLLFIFFVMDAKKEIGGSFSYGAALLFPLAVWVCNWLALRAIGKDELLVKSVDRIR